MKVMMVDPWGTYNMYHYTNGLCESVAKHVDLVLWTNYFFPQEDDFRYPIKRIFFKRSEKMRQGFIRDFVRICEYYGAYYALLRELKKNSYDLVHIQWLLHYKSDLFFLSLIQKLGPKIVYTAHNVLPHRNGKKYSKNLYKIYNKVDKILVHGERIKDEFTSFFNDFKDKVIIQRHGTFTDQDLGYDINLISKEIIAKLKEPEMIFIFFGNIFYNKGVDRLAKIWIDNFKDVPKYLLIIAGKKDSSYRELIEIEPDIVACNNILYIDHFVEDNLLNYLLDHSQLILLPYRYASMSGVIFTAAEFKKPVLSTRAGAIEEYLVDGENSFLVDNSNEEYAVKLKYISERISSDKLAQMGVNLHDHLRGNYSWAKIGENLVDKVYRL